MIKVFVEVTQDIENKKSASEQNISKEIETGVDINSPDVVNAHDGPIEFDEVEELDIYTVEVEMEQEKRWSHWYYQ